MQKQVQKNVWLKSNGAYSLTIRVQTRKNHNFDLFITTISTPNKMFFSERELEKALRDTLIRAAWYGLLFTTAN